MYHLRTAFLLCVHRFCQLTHSRDLTACENESQKETVDLIFTLQCRFDAFKRTPMM